MGAELVKQLLRKTDMVILSSSQSGAQNVMKSSVMTARTNMTETEYIDIEKRGLAETFY